MHLQYFPIGISWHSARALARLDSLSPPNFTSLLFLLHCTIPRTKTLNLPLLAAVILPPWLLHAANPRSELYPYADIQWHNRYIYAYQMDFPRAWSMILFPTCTHLNIASLHYRLLVTTPGASLHEHSRTACLPFLPSVSGSPTGQPVSRTARFRERYAGPRPYNTFLHWQSRLISSQRLRSLPLRPSNTFQDSPCTEIEPLEPHFRPSTLTPAESSDDDDAEDHKHRSGNATHTALHQIPPSSCPPDAAMDVDMGRNFPPLVNGDDLSPWPMETQKNGIVQPSPIPRSLIDQSLNIDAGNPIASNQTLSPANPNSIDMDHDPVLPTEDSKGPNSAKNQEAVWCCPRLPSPISEDEDVPAEMPYTLSNPASPHSHHERSPWNITTGMQTSTNKDTTSEETGSKKVTFFMGYRADCDKCRQKVPGHYSHIIRA